MDSGTRQRVGRAPLLLSLCLSIVSASCSDQRVLIDIALNGVPATATGMRVRPKLEERLLRDPLPPITIPPSETLSYFKASLDLAEAKGKLELTAVLYADDACSVGTGTTELTLSGPGTYRGTIDVMPQVGCELILSKGGDGLGSISSGDGNNFDFYDRTGVSMQCPQQANPLIEQRKVFPFGTRLMLRGNVEDEKASGSVFGGWGDMQCPESQCNIEIGGEPTTLRPLFFAKNVCTQDRVCWRHPLPQGVNLRHISGASAGDVWAAGDRGTILHWNGYFWSSPPRPLHRGQFNAISYRAGATNSIAAVGETGIALQLTGGTWDCPNRAADGTLRGVFGATEKDIWAVGDRGVLSHYDGKGWTQQQAPGGFTGTLHVVNGRSGKDVWAAGEQGTVLHYDGASWMRVQVPTTETLYGMWIDQADQLWVVGDRGASVQFDRDVIKLVQADVPSRLYGVWGSGRRDVWAVGAFGTILHNTGDRWNVTPSGTAQDLLGVWGVSSSEIWAVGERGTILKYNGAFWRADGAVQSAENLNGVWSSSTDTTASIAVGDRGTIFRWTGSDWVLMSPAGQLTTRNLRAAWGSSRTDIWAVGEAGTVARMNGSQVQLVTTGIAVDLNAIWGNTPSDIYAVGQSGSLARYNGTAWSVATLPAAAGATLRAVFGLSPSDLWIAGDSGLLMRWNGTTATVVPSGTVRTLRAIWGSAPNDLWAAGDGGTILHYDGAQWRPDPQIGPLTTSNLFAIYADSKQNVWAAGEGGTLLRRRGGMWAALDTGSTSELRAMTLFVGGALAMVGQSATILELAGEM